MTTEEKIDIILSHVQTVERNCIKVGKKLICEGRVELGLNLIKNGRLHDISKFSGIEFEHLFPGDTLLSEAVKHHAGTNPHHPEYWGGIHFMPEIYLLELVCDCSGRGAEMGTDIRQWFTTQATTKYGFNMNDEVGRKISYFLDLLLVPTFTSPKK